MMPRMPEPGVPPLREAPAVRPPLAVTLLLGVVAVGFAIHASCLTQYGWFRDELYYVTCTHHPAAGYVDQPPLSIWLLGAWRASFGESLVAVRALGVLIGGAVVFAAGALARALGGNRFAQAFAAFAVVVSPLFLGTAHFYSMNVLDQLAWSLALLAAIRALRVGRVRDWALLGLVLGLGLLNKLSVLWLMAGLVPALAVAAARRPDRMRGLAVALAVAAAAFAPHVVWQALNGWPTREFMRNAAGTKMLPVTPRQFFRGQVMDLHPILAPLWIAGLAWCARRRAEAASRLPAVVWLAAAAILLAAGTSRTAYMAAAYPALFAAGAIALERATARRHGILVRAATVALVALAAIPALPLALPLLPVERYIAYAGRLGFAPHSDERTEAGPLPQHFADMHGWHELVDAVARAYGTLTPDERRRVVIYGDNYGEAGAICVLGRPLGLPPAISGHNAFWMWGPGPPIADPVVIVIGGDEADERRVFASVERAGTWTSRYAMPYERDRAIWVCRGAKRSIAQLWPQLRHYI